MDILPNVVMFAVGVAVAYVIYRWLAVHKDGSVTAYEQEMKEILSSDEYKVKRRFEE